MERRVERYVRGQCPVVVITNRNLKCELEFLVPSLNTVLIVKPENFQISREIPDISMFVRNTRWAMGELRKRISKSFIPKLVFKIEFYS